MPLNFLSIAAGINLLHASPEQDRLRFIKHYQERFPSLKLSDYSNGVYAIDPIARQSWQAIEEFPPYEPAIEQGKRLFETPFVNGRQYADCFPNQGIGIANTYPEWSKVRREAVTLAQAINSCRRKNHAPELAYNQPEIVYLQAYMTYTSRASRLRLSFPRTTPVPWPHTKKAKPFITSAAAS